MRLTCYTVKTEADHLASMHNIKGLINKMKFCFLHPNFVMGGAERLILDMTIAVKELGHEASILTGSLSENRFDDIKEKKVDVEVRMSWIPKHIFNKLSGLLNYIRMLILTLIIVLCRRKQYDYVVVDQVALPLILLKLFGIKTVFYCHYPDYLQIQTSNSLLKRLYKGFMYILEIVSMKCADTILFNSEFTRKTALRYLRCDPAKCHILYPTTRINEKTENIRAEPNRHFLCLNRIERRKRHDIVIAAFARLVEETGTDKRLLVAGHLDYSSKDDIIYYKQLKDTIKQYKLENSVSICLVLSDVQKRIAIASSIAVLYPPIDEHFGIVPLEAMALQIPVIAHNSGGPQEIIEHGKTGYLASTDEEWKQYMAQLLQTKENKLKAIQKSCSIRFENKFSPNVFKERLGEILAQLTRKAV